MWSEWVHINVIVPIGGEVRCACILYLKQKKAIIELKNLNILRHWTLEDKLINNKPSQLNNNKLTNKQVNKQRMSNITRSPQGIEWSELGPHNLLATWTNYWSMKGGGGKGKGRCEESEMRGKNMSRKKE